MSPIAAGSRLGPYEILAAAGAGGMGEVFKARDTRLNRTVAIKVLPAHVSENDEARQRFETEARAIAALKHAHICTLYDVGRQDNVDFLVMEFLEGETLESHLNRGPLPLDDALKYAIQIADALDKAHTLGITHRDLKPANVMLTPSGATLLDFGLAKRRAPSEAATGSMPTAPDLTQHGSIIGTVQYMAPEQVEGEAADARTDIFAFGAVLYEMVTGSKAFSGKSQASLMATILQQQPPAMSTLQALTPPALQRVVETCLAKNPGDRWQTAHDVMLQLKWIAGGGAVESVPPQVRRTYRERVAWALAASCLILAGVLAVLYLKNSPTDVKTIEFWVHPAEGTVFGPEVAGIRPFPAISPDGRLLAFQAQEPGQPVRLWLRSLDSVQAQPLAGTEGAGIPFWSPDSRYIAFTADAKLKKVEALGGPVQILCDVTPGSSAEGTWNRDGIILFAEGPGTGPGTNSGLVRVPASGGKPEQVTTPSKELKETVHRAPYFLPDGQHFLFLAQPPNVIYVGSLDSSEPPKRLFASDTRAVYALEGYVLFVQQGTLMAQRFDATRLELSGNPIPVAEHVRGNVPNGRTAFGVSNDGVLVYRTGSFSEREGNRIVWFDRGGKMTDSIKQENDNGRPRLSPDEKRILAQRRTEATCTDCADLWMIDLVRGTNTRFTFKTSAESSGLWSPDGLRIVYVEDGSLFTKSSSGTAKEELLLKSDQGITGVDDWSKDSRHILFNMNGPATGSDIWYLSLDGDRKPQPFVTTRFLELDARFSPNGRWVAYTSNESGKMQVYVQSFPSGNQRIPISVDGGYAPQWRKDGRELYFRTLTPTRALMSVDFKATASSLEPGIPKRLFALPPALGNFEVTEDGQRFLFSVNSNALTTSGPDDDPLTVITNWTSRLKQ